MTRIAHGATGGPIMAIYFKDIILAIAFFLYPFFLLLLSNQLETIGMRKDGSRKFVHISMGLVILFVPFFDHVWFALLPPFIFTIVNLIDYRFGFFSQIQGEERGNVGTILYPISYMILIAIFFHTSYWGLAVLGILTMAFGDASASIFGRALGDSKYSVNGETRSYAGSIAMFITTFILTILLLVFYGPQMGLSLKYLSLLATGFFIAGTATVVEALSIKGSDNITVPLMTAFFGWVLLAIFLPNVLGNQSIVEQPLF